MLAFGDTGIVTKTFVVALYHLRTAPIPLQPVADRVRELPEQMVAPAAVGGVVLLTVTVTVLLLIDAHVVPLVVTSHLA